MKTKEFLVALAIFSGITVLFFYPFFLNTKLPFPGDLLVGNYSPWNYGVPHKAQGSDVLRMLFPWKNFSLESIRKGQIPLWDPYNFSGNPHLANFQSGIFYPLNFIFLILPFNFAWSLFIISQPLLASLFTYLFLREIRIGKLGAILGAISFSYSLYFIVWLEWGNIGHAILWLPAALVSIEKIIRKPQRKWVLFLIFSLVASVLAGYVQVTIYLFLIVFAYSFFRKFSSFVTVSVAGAISLLLCSVQLLPTLEIFEASARKAYSLEKISGLLLPWFYPLVSFVPDFFGNPASRNYWFPGTYIERVLYIGTLPLFFALLAIFYGRKEKFVLFFGSVAAIVLLFTLNLPLGRFFYGNVPVFSTMVPTRALYLWSFPLAVLAGFGVDLYLKSRKSRKIFLIGLLFLSFYISLWLFIFMAPNLFPGSWWISHLAVSRRNLVIPSLVAFSGISILGLSFWLKRKRVLFLAVCLITLLDLFFYFRKITPFSPADFVYPQTEIIKFLRENAGINRTWGYGTAYFESNFSTILKTYSVDGYDPLFISRYGELISSSEDGLIKDPIPRADVILAKGYGQEALRNNPFRQRLLNLLGVKYAFYKNELLNNPWQPDYQTFPSDVYQLVWQKGAWQVYENKQVIPRIFLVGGFRVETEKQKIVNLILSPEFNLGKEIVLEETTPADFILEKDGETETQLLNYQPNRIEIKTSTTRNKLLFLSDNWYPGWQATVDEQPTKIYRADYSFRAIALPAGEHRVVFEYKPSSFSKGAKISLATLFLILGFLSFEKIRCYRQRSS